MKKVALAGATGDLGNLILQELLKDPEAEVLCLVREGSEAKLAEQDDRITMIKGDLLGSTEDVLNELTRDCTAVISAVQGQRDIIVDGQLRLFRAASRQGVKKFIPSDFSFDHFKLEPGENFNSDIRTEFAGEAQKIESNTRIIHIMNGVFLDKRVLFGFMGAFDLAGGKMFVWGDGQEKMDLTTYADTAAYTAKVALTDKEVPNHFKIAGDRKTIYEVKDIYERHTGQRLTVEHGGTLADMKKLIKERLANDPQNFYGYLPLMYYRPVLSGQTKLTELHNDYFPEVKTTSTEEYIQSNF